MHTPDRRENDLLGREDVEENDNDSGERLREENCELLTHPYKSSHGSYTDILPLTMGLCPNRPICKSEIS